MQEFYSHGKLLITGEYVVLDGASALAVPTKLGQELFIEEISLPMVSWKSFDPSGSCWFEKQFPIENILDPSIPENSTNAIEKRLLSLLRRAAELNPKLLNHGQQGYAVTTKVDFPLDWGLGSSSTLVANVAKWFAVDPYELLKNTFGGSGYDLAVALHGQPLTYQLTHDHRSVLSTSFYPSFHGELFFVYLNRKQDSRDSIRHYRGQDPRNISRAVEKISAITHQIANCMDLTEFELLLEIHEKIIAQLVNLPTIKNSLFADYPRTIKSLGGWGGDFILATGGRKEMAFFQEKGYHTILPYSEMILQK